MSFTNRITRQPRPFDPAIGQDALSHVAGLDPSLAPLVIGAAGCSPYLSGLMSREGAWLVEAVHDPEAAVAAIFASLPEVPLDELSDALREAKRRIALLTGLADLGGVWPLEVVTQVLTDLGDLAVDVTIKALVAAEIRRGKLPGMGIDDVPTAGGLLALAMGKMGAGELNYSSDIDLICCLTRPALTLTIFMMPARALSASPAGWPRSCRMWRRADTCFAPICGCALIPIRRRCVSRRRWPSVITRVLGARGNGPPISRRGPVRAILRRVRDL